MSKTIRNEPSNPDSTRKGQPRNPHARRAIATAALVITMVAGSATAGVQPTQRKPAQPVNGGVVNVNTATLEQLAYLPGVGPKLASEIYKIAEAGLYIYDPRYFDQKAKRWIKDPESLCDHKCHMRTLADLDKVKGIGPAKLAKMAPFVVFEGETTATGKITVPKPNGIVFKAPDAKPRCAPGTRCAD